MSTAMLMACFYLLWRQEGYTSQEALRRAQIWLRDSTREQKKEYFYSLGKQAGSRAEAARFFFNQLCVAEPDVINFSSPFYWAAFTYTGVKGQEKKMSDIEFEATLRLARQLAGRLQGDMDHQLRELIARAEREHDPSLGMDITSLLTQHDADQRYGS